MHGKLQEEVAAVDTRDPTMCYKTNGWFTELHLQKMKFRLASFGESFTVQEHSLHWLFFLFHFKCCWLA